MLEVWRPVVGYEGRYEVSNTGRVRSLDRVLKNRTMKGRILKLGTRADGYKCCSLSGKTANVHVLVAQAFIENPDSLPVVDHINGDRGDNRVENLRWASYHNNMINGPEYRELLARIEELESEVKRCQTEVLRLQTLCSKFSTASTKSD